MCEEASPTGTIYGLHDPRTGELRYVGKTVRSLSSRLTRHLNRARRCSHDNLHVYSWIRFLLSKGVQPEIRPLQQDVSSHLLDEREQHWIAYFHAHETDLCNLTDGGEGGIKNDGWRYHPDGCECPFCTQVGSSPCPDGCTCSKHQSSNESHPSDCTCVFCTGAGSSEAGSWGNHLRWHARRGRPKEGCRFCREEAVGSSL